MRRYAVRVENRPANLRTQANFIDADTPWSFVPHLVVDGPRDVDTGLVDLHGRHIVRLAEPIGFRWD